MCSKKTPDDQKLVDSLSVGGVMAFRSSIYQPAFIVGHPHLFINNDWIDAAQLRAFLENTTSNPDESVPVRVKIEHDASDVSEKRSLAVPDVWSACELAQRIVLSCGTQRDRTSTTIRKSRESRALDDERALPEMEINAEKEVRNASAARLKTLQARKSATRKPAAAATHRHARLLWDPTRVVVLPRGRFLCFVHLFPRTSLTRQISDNPSPFHQ
ncbi:hypothetical protein B0H19DRAFT_1251198 [Mycena capillaripes]|nr:hypothetical protein B0H19DRAFT_1251198 [Mycena capillaripes]